MIRTLRINGECKKTVGKLLFRRSFIFFIILSLFLFSCKTTRVEKIASPVSPEESSHLLPEKQEWQMVTDGIDFLAVLKKDVGISYCIARIHLKTPGLEIETFKSSSDWQNSSTVKSFAKQNNALVAINTSPFYSKNRLLPWSKGRAIGIVVSEGEMLVAPNENYSAIAFYFDENSAVWNARIFDRQTEIVDEERFPDEASGGFWTILRDGKIREFKDVKDCRSAVATSDAGSVLYLLAGENLTYRECALIFKGLGCDVAMQFDGGSSAQLVVQGENTVHGLFKRGVVAMVCFRITS